MVAGGDRKKLLLMKERKKDFDYMTSSVLMEQQKNLLASQHFKGVYDHLLFVPSIGITLVSGILAVLSQSGLYSEHTQSLCVVCIAILASFSVFWQSLTKQLDYGGRAMLHDSAATALNKIYKIAIIRSREQRTTELDNDYNRSKDSEQPRGGSIDLERAEQDVHVMIGVTNQDSSGSIPKKEGNIASKKSADLRGVDGEDPLTLSKQFEQATQGCTSVVPIRITAAFNALESRIVVCNKRLVPSENAMPKVAWEKVFPALYHQLTLTIIGSKLWPYVVPGAEWAVDKTLTDFGTHDAATLLKVLVKRTQVIDYEYSSLAITDTMIECAKDAQTSSSFVILGKKNSASTNNFGVLS